MKVIANNTNFKNRVEIVKKDGIRYTDVINDNDVVVKHTEFDYIKDRFIRQDTFDESGKPLRKWWFEYNPKGLVEHLKSEEESYTRTQVNEIVGDLQVRTEKYISETHPEKNYIHEIIRDWSGKMLSFICNGKDLMKGK